MKRVINLATAVLTRPSFGQFVRFGMVGTVNTVLDFSVYYGLTRYFDFWGRHLVTSAVASFAVGVTSSFILNNFWTFRQEASGWLQRAPRFLLVALSGMSWNALLLWIMVSLGTYDLIAKASATVVVLFWNFNMQKRWTFRV